MYDGLVEVTFRVSKPVLHLLVLLCVSLQAMLGGHTALPGAAVAACEETACSCCEVVESCCGPQRETSRTCGCCARSAPRPGPVQERAPAQPKQLAPDPVVLRVLAWGTPMPMSAHGTPDAPESPARRVSCGLRATRILV
jgi:hypothetical protein